MGAKRMQGHRNLGLFIAVAVLAGCHSGAPKPEAAAAAPAPVATPAEPSDGTVVGNDKTSIEAAIEASASPNTTETVQVPSGTRIPLAENAPDSYVVKRGDTLWAI